MMSEERLSREHAALWTATNVWIAALLVSLEWRVTIAIVAVGMTALLIAMMAYDGYIWWLKRRLERLRGKDGEKR